MKTITIICDEHGSWIFEVPEGVEVVVKDYTVHTLADTDPEDVQHDDNGMFVLSRFSAGQCKILL